MTFRTYLPKRGDLVHMNFSPSTGHEMADRHYALVISGTSYNRTSRMAIVCPITSRVHGWPFEVSIPSGLLHEKSGVGQVNSVVVVDAVRQVDYGEREMSFVAQAPPATMDEVLQKLFALVDTESS